MIEQAPEQVPEEVPAVFAHAEAASASGGAGPEQEGGDPDAVD